MFTSKDLRRLIIPLVIEQFLAVTIGIADTVMVSGVGEAAVSGVALVDAINILLLNIFSALATGGAIVSSQYIGREDRESACVAAKQLIIVVTCLSAIIGGLCMIGDKAILQMVYGNVEAEVMANSIAYFFYSALSYPFLAIYNAGAALFRAMGNSKISMYTGLMMNILNISFNALFIFGFQMGAAGAAIGSLFARVIGAVVMLILLRKPENKIYIDSYLHLEIKPPMVKNILKIGVPNGLENGMFQIGKILVQGLVASFGTAAIAANAVASSVANCACIPGAAVGLSMITVVGQCVGAKNYNEARKYIKLLTKISYASMLVVNIVIIISLPLIMQAFSLTAETAQIAKEILFWHSVFAIILWPASFTMPNGLRAANDVKYTMTVSIISMWLCRICMSYVLGQFLGLGVLGTWFAMFLDWACRIVAFQIRFRSGKWENKQILA